MKKKLFVVLTLFAVVLVSCTPPAAAPAESATAVPAVETSAPSAPEAAPTEVSAEPVVAGGGPAACKAGSEPLPLPEISDQDWSVGPDDAKITILEYSDYQCPFCATLDPVLVQLLKEDPQIRFVYRHFPLPSHPKALITAQAAESAGLQGKFFEMNSLLLENQTAWNSMDDAAFETWLGEKVKELGLDEAKFASDLKSDAVVAKVKLAQDDALALGIPYTPFMVVNGQVYNGPRDVEGMQTYFDFLANKQFKECPPATTTDVSKKYTATIKTEKGDVVVELFPDKAPVTVNSFVFLAQNNWFDGVTFHRVIPGFVAQTGDPTGTGAGGPGYQFGNEISDLKFDQAGRMGMANAGPDTNGSQFFITYSAVPDLDGKYTVFGQVTQGMDILEKLTERIPENEGALAPGDKIISVTVVEN